MQLGAPLVEAKLRRRAFQQQMHRDQAQRAFEANQRDADRLLARDRLKQQLTHDLTQREADRSHKTSEREAGQAFSSAENEKQRFNDRLDQMLKDIAANERMGKTFEHQSNLAKSAQEARSRLSKQESDQAVERSKLPTNADKMMDRFQKSYVESKQIETMLNNPSILSVMDPDERREKEARYLALRSELQMLAAAQNKVVQEGDFGVYNSLMPNLFGEAPADLSDPVVTPTRPVQPSFGVVTQANDMGQTVPVAVIDRTTGVIDRSQFGGGGAATQAVSPPAPGESAGGDFIGDTIDTFLLNGPH